MLAYVLSEKVRMSSCIRHKEYKFTIILIPYKQPVWLDMTFPITFVLTMKNMGMILLRQATILGKNGQYFGQ